jgi:hypothetical protein
VGAVLNVAAAPLVLVFSAVLFLFTTLKGDLAELRKDLGKKTDDGPGQKDGRPQEEPDGCSGRPVLADAILCVQRIRCAEVKGDEAAARSPG